MKFLVSILFSLVFAFNCHAQTVTKNVFPKDIKGARLNFKVDFSEALICGMNEKEFSEYEKDWEEDKPTIVKNFRSGANLSIGKTYAVGDYQDASYTIMVKVNTITDEGYIVCDANIIDKDGNVLFTLEKLTGGKEPAFMIGTKLARMKIWATLTGKALGDILKKELPK